MKKRFQFIGKNGVEWSNWFSVRKKGSKHQLGKKLLNEYMDDGEDYME